jgi:hypothetical protein
MSQDDETVERVARAIYEAMREDDPSSWWAPLELGGRKTGIDGHFDLVAIARAALSAIPERELLAEALEALTPFEQEAVLWDDLPEPPDEDKKLWIGSWGNRYMTDEARFSLGDLRRARAAADKIRAALTQEPQT